MSPFTKDLPSVGTIDPYRLFDSRPTFSHVATTTGSSRIIATAGQVGADENGVVPKDVEAQIELAFTNLRRCLEAAGATVKDVFKLVYYIVDYDSSNRRHTKYLEAFLNGHRPATTLVPVPKLAIPEYLFEIEAYAAVRQHPPTTVDVVVVGAGLSGLQAAYDLQKSGLSCVVVEARDRVGGKTWSVDPLGNGGSIDVGAAWINDTSQAKIFDLVRSFGLDTVIQNTKGNVVQEDLGGSLSAYPYGTAPLELSEHGGVENMIYIRDLAEKICQTIDIRNPVGTGGDLDKYSLQEWAESQGGGKTAVASVAVWTRAMLGLEPSEVSALFFLDYCKSGGGLMKMRSDHKNGGQYMRVVQGTQAISIELANLLQPGSVILSSPVRSIEQTPHGAIVSAGRGEFICRRVIVSVPTPLYQEIDFSPPLPLAKRELSKANRLGYTCKVMVSYSQPWWRAHNLTGILQSFEGPISVTRDSSVDEKGAYSLTCFVVGQPGRELSKASQKERFEAVLAQIKKVYSPFVDGKVLEPIAIVEHEWAKDQWAQGCPCPAAPPGAMTKFGHALRTPHGKVHFIGTETAFEWKGYMDGAIRSGERGAKEVIFALTQARL